MIVVELTTTILVAAEPSKATVAPVRKSVPVSVTDVPPASGPLEGFTETRSGAGPIYV